MAAINSQSDTIKFGYVKDGKVFLKAYLDFPDRQIGVVKESEAASIRYFENRYDLAKKKVEELEEFIEKYENKGSYLMKLIHMRKYLSEFNGLGDFTSLFARLDEKEKYLRELIEENREKNYALKKQFIEEAKEIADSVLVDEKTVETQKINWKGLEENLRELKAKWIRTGLAKEELNEDLEKEFSEYYGLFFQRRKDFFKSQKEVIQRKKKKYKVLILKAQEIKDSEDFEATSEQFKELQKAWKTIGKIPQNKLVRLWEEFSLANNQFFFRYKQYKAGMDAGTIKDFDPEVARKMKQQRLCEEAEKLIGVGSTDALEKAKNLLVEWKKIANNFKLYDRDLAIRFRNSCDVIFEEGYLARVVNRKYPDFEDKPKLDQLKIKVSFMKELVRKDQELIDSMYLTGNDRNVNTQKRKLSVKKHILESLEEELHQI